MANSKVQLANGTVLMDLTDTTAVASDVASGKYFYTADGIKTLGTNSGGSGGQGLVKKTGSFVLASDYTYSTSLANGYSGSILVSTGLSYINDVVLWVVEWAERTMGDTTGAGTYIANSLNLRTVDNVAYPGYYYPAYGYIKNNATGYSYSDNMGGIVLHEACPNDIPEGSFGFRCRSNSFPIRSGMTVKWEAIGT